MGFRLLPRFAGRRPLPRALNVAVFALLFSATVLRAVAQPLAGDPPSDAVLRTSEILWGAGATAFGAIVLFTLLRGRGGTNPWRVFAFAGGLWWLAWTAASFRGGRGIAGLEALTSPAFDDALAWAVMLGAIGNFTWAVQSRSVPIFFGRKTPSITAVGLPGLLLNTGAATIFAAAWIDEPDVYARLMGAGFDLSGAGLAWLAPVAGSCWGSPKRLRPRARAAARFVLFANLAAVACGFLLILAGTQTLLDDRLADAGLRDAARHAFGVGVITMLIVGMAQLVAPFFALRRVEAGGAWLDSAVFWMLALATVLRAVAGLLAQQVDSDLPPHLSAAAGAMAWAALVVFAGSVVSAIRNEPRLKANLAAAAAGARAG
jgi:hypothetical protein